MTDKEKLESFIRTLDKFVIGFGIPLAIGVVGEDVFHSPRFGVLVAIGVIGDVSVGIPNFFKRRELEALQKAENLQQEREIASLRRDAAEATRRAEESRLAALQLQEKLVRRHITEENQVNQSNRRWIARGRRIHYKPFSIGCGIIADKPIEVGG